MGAENIIPANLLTTIATKYRLPARFFNSFVADNLINWSRRNDTAAVFTFCQQVTVILKVAHQLERRFRSIRDLMGNRPHQNLFHALRNLRINLSRARKLAEIKN